MKKLILFIFIFLSSAFLFASDFILDDNIDSLEISNNLSVVPDKDGEIDIKKIISNNLFYNIPDTGLKLDYNNYTYWIHFTLKNDSKKNKKWILSIQDPMLNNVILYTEENEKLISSQSGIDFPYSKREIYSRTIAFNLNINSGEKKDFYLRIYGPMSTGYMPFTIYSSQKFEESQMIEYIFFGSLFGVLIIMILINLFIYIETFEIIYMLFSLLCLYTFYNTFVTMGFLGLVTSNLIQIEVTKLIHIPSFFAFSISILFSRKYLNIDKYTPVLISLYNFLFYLNLIIAVFSIFIRIDLRLSVNLMFGLFLVSNLFPYLNGFIVAFKGYAPAYYFLIGFGFPVIGIIIMFMRIFGYLPNNFFTVFAFYMANFIEFIVLGFGVSNTINVLNAQLKQTNNMLEDAKINLEKTVIERTRELIEERDLLEKTSREDYLTKLYNRRYILEILEEELIKASSGTHSVSLLLLDLDHFKDVNDTYGHLVGDESLKTLAECISKIIDGKGYCGRFGGEEFLIILPYFTVDDAIIIAEEIRKKISYIPILKEKNSPNLSISIGVAASLNADETITSLIIRADKALYKAKETGRNRVVSIKF